MVDELLLDEVPEAKWNFEEISAARIEQTDERLPALQPVVRRNAPFVARDEFIEWGEIFFVFDDSFIVCSDPFVVDIDEFFAFDEEFIASSDCFTAASSRSIVDDDEDTPSTTFSSLLSKNSALSRIDARTARSRGQRRTRARFDYPRSDGGRPSDRRTHRGRDDRHDVR
ncbi:MAG TPA: hypothetical protein VIY73_14865, partial [Polyangiaceae bacterium]